MSRYSGRLPESYAAAEKALKGRHVRTIVNNTRASRVDDETIEIQYHGNTLARFHADGRRMFTTDGWDSTWTNHRLNAMLPATLGFVIQGYVAHVQIRNADGTVDLHHADTLRLSPSGEIVDITKEH